MGFIAWVRRFIAGEPAIAAWIAGGGLLSLFAFVLHFSRGQEAAASVIVASLATIWTAVWAKPPEVALATGALASVFAAMGAFGFHPSAHLVALAGSLLAVLMAHIHRSQLTPWLPSPPKPPRPVT